MTKIKIEMPKVDEENALRNACRKCISRGYSIAWMKINIPGLFYAFPFEHVYSVYMQERHKALHSTGVKVSTFLF